MAALIDLFAGAILVGGVGSIAVSLAVIAYVRYQEYENGTSTHSDEIVQEKLRAYRAIMEAIVALNRAAVEMDDDEFYTEADKLLLEKGSALKQPYANVSETFQKHYHIVGEKPHEAINEYLNYLASYQEEGAKIGELLALGGEAGRAMRQDLNMPDLTDTDTELPTMEPTDPPPQ